jgi:hypothetical protein
MAFTFRKLVDIFTRKRRTSAFPAGNQGSTKSDPAVVVTPAVAAAEEPDHLEQLIASGAWIAAGSSWIEEYRWDVATAWTYWNTKNGAKYVYTKPMNIQVFKGWVQSDSPGRYWWSHIRGVFSPAVVLSKGIRGKKGTPNVIRIVNTKRRK